MSTSIKTDAEKAIEMIKQSIAIKESAFPRRDVDVLREMTDTIGESLINLLQGTQIAPLRDWRTKLYDYESFLYQLLVLLAKPGILEKLDEHEQKTAADKLEKLISFFRELSDGYTKEYLDFLAIDQFGIYLSNEDLEKTIKYYDFKKVYDNDVDVNSSTAWFSYTIDADRLEKMKKYFKSNVSR